MLVKLKLAGDGTPEAVAVTVYEPVVAFAVKAEDVATPLEFVVSVSVAVPFANIPLAPVEGAVNVTLTPLVGAPLVVTVATNGAANALLTTALCDDPLVAAIDSTGGVVVVEEDDDEDPQPAKKAMLPNVRIPIKTLLFTGILLSLRTVAPLAGEPAVRAGFHVRYGLHMSGR